MSLSDPIGDMLTRIRNGQQARKATIECPSSKVRIAILNVLQSEGYIRGYTVEKQTVGGGDKCLIELKYHEGERVIKEIARVSKPGRRVYSKVTDLPRVYNGLGILIISTPKGIMSDNQARDENVGGEVLCRVF